MNLVLGAISDYPWYVVEPFFVSWKKCFTNCECVMFFRRISRYSVELLHSLGVKTLMVDKNYENDSMNCRWLLFRDYLYKYGKEYDQVLLTDVRDVVFRNDLFSTYSTKAPYLGIAVERETLEDDIRWNGSWMKRKFGEAEYEKHKNKQALCCGTIWGTASEVLLIMEKMADLVYSKQYDIFYPGNDQTVMQYLIFNNLLGDVKINFSDPMSDNCPVLTLADFSEYEASEVLQNKYAQTSVIHQYDRYTLLKESVDKEYRQYKQKVDIDECIGILNRFDKAYLSLVSCQYGDAWESLSNLYAELGDSSGDIEKNLKWADVLFLFKVIKNQKDMLDNMRSQIILLLWYILCKLKLGYITLDDVRTYVGYGVKYLNNTKQNIMKSEKMLQRVSMHYKNNNVTMSEEFSVLFSQIANKKLNRVE